MVVLNVNVTLMPPLAVDVFVTDVVDASKASAGSSAEMSSETEAAVRGAPGDDTLLLKGT